MKAKITWNLTFNTSSLPINVNYYPMIKTIEKPELINWSFVIKNLEIIDECTSIADVKFLMKEAPQCLLKTGFLFEIFEGSKRVGQGMIL